MTSTTWTTSTTSPTTSTRGPRARSRTARRLASTAAAIAVALAGSLPAFAAATDEARAVVDRTAEQVLEVLREPELSQQERRARIEEIANRRFDFETMTKLVLARSWRGLDRTQRREFVDAFKAHLSESYGSRIERYDQGGVEITGERAEPRGDVTVHTRIVGGEADGVVVDYRMRRREGRDWQVIDVVIEGVSLISSFRDQFRAVIEREGPEALLQRLRERRVPEPPGTETQTSARECAAAPVA